MTANAQPQFDVTINYRNPSGKVSGMQTGGPSLDIARAKLRDNLDFYATNSPDCIITEAYITARCAACNGTGETMKPHKPYKRHTHTAKCYQVCPECHDQPAPVVENWMPLDLAPATNTEARQLAELDAEQPEAQADTIRELMSKYDERRTAWVGRFGNDTGFDAWFTGQVAPKTSPATLLDDVQTLPLFSGTCPRVADPGRFDPPARRTDTQPTLF